MRESHDYGDDVINKLTVERLMEFCSAEERFILYHIHFGGKTYEEIGQLVGKAFPREDKTELSGSGVRYLRDQAYAKLRKLLGYDGIHGISDLNS
jgi:hypothetical protein